MLDLTQAPDGIAEYAETLRGLSDREVFDRVSEIEHVAFIGGADIQGGDEHWKFRCDLAELERRLGGWLGVTGLPGYGPQNGCPKCGSQRETVSTRYCVGGVGDNRKLCYGREEEHFHRGCPRCGYEWLEAVFEKEQP